MWGHEGQGLHLALCFGLAVLAARCPDCMQCDVGSSWSQLTCALSSGRMWPCVIWRRRGGAGRQGTGQLCGGRDSECGRRHPACAHHRCSGGLCRGPHGGAGGEGAGSDARLLGFTAHRNFFIPAFFRTISVATLPVLLPSHPTFKVFCSSYVKLPFFAGHREGVTNNVSGFALCFSVFCFHAFCRPPLRSRP